AGNLDLCVKSIALLIEITCKALAGASVTSSPPPAKRFHNPLTNKTFIKTVKKNINLSIIL
ncbi:hypothetical protein, partial [Bacteroides heparinolyticus]|uniref:hypothetical protein n=1 Tax=Prevotella heparinolytica TaxID=28113 RepID=UPI00359FC917